MSNKQTKLNYFKEVDKKIKMIPITFDVEFKSIFERNLDLLKRFLISTLNLDLDINTTTITISNNELIKEIISLEVPIRVVKEGAELKKSGKGWEVKGENEVGIDPRFEKLKELFK